MKTKNNQLIPRAPNPFDESAEARLINMGVIGIDGEISQQVISVFADVFSGLFFDDLCDFCDDPGDIAKYCGILNDLFAEGDSRRVYLVLSVLYDRMGKPLPDPVWWLAGNAAAVDTFVLHFVPGLRRLADHNAGNRKNKRNPRIANKGSEETV
jgi:hypothetical protein